MTRLARPVRPRPEKQESWPVLHTYDKNKTRWSELTARDALKCSPYVLLFALKHGFFNLGKHLDT